MNNDSCPMPDRYLVGWLHTYARNNYWRVANIMELTDLHQEGFAVYSKCHQRYPNLPPKMLMAYFKTAYYHRILDLAARAHDVAVNESSQYWDAISCDENETPYDRLRHAESSGDLGGILQVIADAPSAEVRNVLTTFLTEGVVLISRPIINRLKLATETPSEYMSRLLGWEPVLAGQVLRQTRQYLHSSMVPG